MHGRRTTWTEIALGMLTLVLVVSLSYGWAYVSLSTYYPLGHYAFREYHQPWLVRCFRPAAWVETNCRGVTIYVIDEDLPVSRH